MKRSTFQHSTSGIIVKNGDKQKWIKRCINKIAFKLAIRCNLYKIKLNIWSDIRSLLIETNTVCRTHCWHDIYISDYLRMELINWTLREKREKQTWSKQRIANISSMNECHKIDTTDTSSLVRKTVTNTAPAIKKKMNKSLYDGRLRKRWKTLYEDRSAWSLITKQVRASKCGTTRLKARQMCVDTKSRLSTAQDTQQKLRVTSNATNHSTQQNYSATGKIVSTWNMSGMSIVLWTITSKI